MRNMFCNGVFRMLIVFFSIFTPLFTSCSSTKHIPERNALQSYRLENENGFVFSHFSKNGNPLIILDPGHGGYDEGAHLNGMMEKKMTLKTALLTKKHLEEMGYRVILTRSRDAFISLSRRVSIANKNKGALFVSLHYNSSPNPAAKGIEIFYSDSKEIWRTRASKRLANCILFQMVDQTGAHSRGVKEKKFYVVRETQIPAVLIEVGFITNPEEASLLKEQDYQEKLASGIAQGVDKYVKS